MKLKFSFRYAFLASSVFMTASACNGDPINFFLIGVSLAFWFSIGAQEPLEKALYDQIEAQREYIAALEQRVENLKK